MVVPPSKVLQKQAPAQSDEGFCLWPSSTIPILTARRDPDGTRTEPIHGRGAIEEPSLSLAIPRLLHSVIAKQEDVLALPILPPSCKFRSIELPRL